MNGQGLADLTQIIGDRDRQGVKLFDHASQCGGGQVVSTLKFGLGNHVVRREQAHEVQQSAADPRVF
ncbi:hypothetical protein D3C73_1294240 [compost metagenome]